MLTLELLTLTVPYEDGGYYTQERWGYRPPVDLAARKVYDDLRFASIWSGDHPSPLNGEFTVFRSREEAELRRAEAVSRAAKLAEAP